MGPRVQGPGSGVQGPVIAVAFPREDYVAALEKAGATVRVLSPSDDPLPDALDQVDGVLLTGGPDVRPSIYGAAATHPTVEVDETRDAYELPLARAALTRALPLLAICRGVQVLNVAAGGTLIQDLPSEHPSPLTHSLTEPRDVVAHDVHVTTGSRLAALLTGVMTHEGRVGVNSRHHQAIDRVAEGFTVTAVAPDGVVEAIEQPAAPFCIGVQWHPENFHRTGRFAGLFDGLVEAARSNTARHSTCGVPGNMSKASIDVSS